MGKGTRLTGMHSPEVRQIILRYVIDHPGLDSRWSTKHDSLYAYSARLTRVSHSFNADYEIALRILEKKLKEQEPIIRAMNNAHGEAL